MRKKGKKGKKGHGRLWWAAYRLLRGRQAAKHRWARENRRHSRAMVNFVLVRRRQRAYLRMLHQLKTLFRHLPYAPIHPKHITFDIPSYVAFGGKLPDGEKTPLEGNTGIPMTIISAFDGKELK